MMMPGRSYSAGISYRYGFNGKENDNEVKGEGNTLDFGERIYDSRIGRFFKVDLFENVMPSWTPYRFSFDNPIKYMDGDGNFEIDAATAKKYPALNNYLKNIATQYAKKPEQFRKDFKTYSGLTDEQIKEMLTYGKGPRIMVRDLDKKHKIFNPKGKGLNAVTVLSKDEKGRVLNADPSTFIKEMKIKKGKGLIYLDDDVVDNYEKIHRTEADKKGATLLLESTVLHEGSHYGTGVTGKDIYAEKGLEIGKELEKTLYGEDINLWNSVKVANPTTTPSSKKQKEYATFAELKNSLKLKAPSNE